MMMIPPSLRPWFVVVVYAVQGDGRPLLYDIQLYPLVVTAAALELEEGKGRNSRMMIP
jgi:hypothetical protein